MNRGLSISLQGTLRGSLLGLTCCLLASLIRSVGGGNWRRRGYRLKQLPGFIFIIFKLKRRIFIGRSAGCVAPRLLRRLAGNIP